MKAKVLFGAMFVLAVIGLIAETQRISPTKNLMRKKLDHAQSILEGITLENFELIANNAAKLGALTQEAAFRVPEGRDYAEHSALFLRNVEGLKKAARERNLDGATLAYTKLTFSCVECHKSMREREGAEVLEGKTLSEQLVEPPPELIQARHK